VDRGGAERVLLELHRLFPEAPIFTSVFDANGTLDEFRSCDVRTSFLQALRPTLASYKKLLPLFPTAFQTFDFDAYDLVISSASAFAKAVRLPLKTHHICYCYTPPRFVWYWDSYRSRQGIGMFTAQTVKLLLPYLRRTDFVAAQRVDRFVTLSLEVARRIRSCYSKPADVVYAPVDLTKFNYTSEPSDYFLVVSRLQTYKRVDTVIQAFNRLGIPLKIAGDGPDLERLREMSGPTITFLGHVTDDALVNLYAKCVAVILPGAEDLGLAPLEANACGRPVVAYAGGGALETVVPGVTGVLFGEQTVDSLIAAVVLAQRLEVRADRLRMHAEQFSTTHFREAFSKIVTEVVSSPRA
jgi:glycosyltransferase involved in cell wall biosynthesis